MELHLLSVDEMPPVMFRTECPANRSFSRDYVCAEDGSWKCTDVEIAKLVPFMDH
jgi:hypothetical protein